MVELLLIVGILVSMFVAYNIGGSTTGPAFGPAVGADAISKTVAAALMGLFFFVGAWTIGRNVVTKLGTELVIDTGLFTLESSIVVLFFIGIALLVGNVFGVPASMSMTAVGAIAGLALAGNVLDIAVMGESVTWWVVSPVIGFWVSLIIGRYFYARVNYPALLAPSRLAAVGHSLRAGLSRTDIVPHDPMWFERAKLSRHHERRKAPFERHGRGHFLLLSTARAAGRSGCCDPRLPDPPRGLSRRFNSRCSRALPPIGGRESNPFAVVGPECRTRGRCPRTTGASLLVAPTVLGVCEGGSKLIDGPRG